MADTQQDTKVCKYYQLKRPGPGQTAWWYTRRACPHGLHACAFCGYNGHGVEDCIKKRKLSDDGHGAEDCIKKHKLAIMDVTQAQSNKPPPPTGFAEDEVIDLLQIKEEEEERCWHAKKDSSGQAFPQFNTLPVGVWEGNKVEDTIEALDKVLQSMDSTIMQENMRAWGAMKQHMKAYMRKYDYYYMNTRASKYRGFLAVCKKCGQCMDISWHRTDGEPQEPKRRLMREFFCFGTAGSHRNPIQWQRNFFARPVM